MIAWMSQQFSVAIAKKASRVTTLVFTRRITEVFYSCFAGKFFAKAAPGRKLAGDQWPIRIRGAQCKGGIA
jgi:hypothetical protein